MADISQFKLHDVIYDVKDIVARNMGVPTGGTVSQVLVKNSGTDYDIGLADPESTPFQGSRCGQ